MQSVNVDTQMEQAKFAAAATEYFKEYPQCSTYAVGDPTPGELLAIRWNCMSVIVVKLDPETPVLHYEVHQFIQSDLPPRAPTHNS